MASNWATYQLQDICEFINGFAFKSTDYIEPGSSAIEVFRMGYIERGGGFKEDSTPVFVPRDYGRDLSKFHLRPADITIAMTDMKDRVAILGNTAWIRDANRFVLNQRVGCIRVKQHALVDPRFLYFYSNWQPHVDYLRTRANSGVQVNLSTAAIKEAEVTLPSLNEQKAIAYILGTLDDKIELNRQMNATLEAMAQALFKSWFVDFDPVIDNALAAGNPIPEPLQARAEARAALGDQRKPPPEAIQKQFPDRFVFNEDMGWVPEGWSNTTLGSVCEKITDGSHSSPKSVENGLPMASVKDMHNWGIDLDTCRKINREDFDQLVRNGCQPEPGDVLIAKDGSYLKHIFVLEKKIEMVLLSSIAILRPNYLINSHILSFTLKRPDVVKQMENYVSGAVLQRIVLKDFRRFPILLPPKELQQSWFAACEASLLRCWANVRENESMSSLRGVLLPKLLSGQLRIPDAEKQLAEAL